MQQIKRFVFCRVRCVLLLMFGFAANAFAQAATQGQWTVPFELGAVAIHAHLLPNGKVLFWAGGDAGSPPRILDLATMTTMPISAPSTTYVFCSGHAFLPDGRLLVTGGQNACLLNGEPHTNIFDHATNTWAPRDSSTDMNLGRWYPTNCALGNGELLVASGTYCTAGSCLSRCTVNPLPQVWQLSGGWRSLTSAELDLPLYPWLHAAPDGRVFYSGPGVFTKLLDTNGPGAWSAGPSTNLLSDRGAGSSVWYDDYKVMIAGGGSVPPENLPTNTAEVINLRAGVLKWRSVASMANRRTQMDSTVLADGKVLVTGGTSGMGVNNPCGTVLAAELWDPATETWSTMASMTHPRIYHSTALLLPDGRVLAAGSTTQSPAGYEPCTITQPGRTNAEIFAPPYLFNPDGTAAARPSIASAPSTIGYGQTFTVASPEAAAIKQVTLVRLSSVTHSFNQNQRFTRLNFFHGVDGLQVTAPASGNLSPPGHYMLFIINQNGVPSIARIVQLAGNWLTPASDSFATAGGSGTVKVTFTSAAGSPPPVSNAPWITVDTENSSPDAVVYLVAENTTGVPRTGTITIAGVTFTVFQSADFPDVPPTHQFYLPISKLYARGVTAGVTTPGCAAGTFCPDGTVTRRQAAVLIERAIGVFTPPTPTSQRFTDVVPESFGYTYIDDFAFRRITVGCGVNLFCPDVVVTREVAAIFIERASGIHTPPAPASQRFSDVAPDRLGYAHIDDFAERGITLGCGPGIFCPDSEVSRGELAAFLVRAFGL